MEINQDTFRAAMRQPVDHPEDCRFIVGVAKDRLGIDMTLEEAAKIWAWSYYKFRPTAQDEELVVSVIRQFVEARTGG
jgi:hypothetical protein